MINFNNSLKLLTLLFVLVSLAQVNNALTCYQCSGVCTGNEAATSCVDNTFDRCMKTFLNYPGGSMTLKSCATASTCKQNSISVFGWGFWVACCSTDSCNHALSTATPKLYVILVSAMAYVFYYLRS